MSSNYPEGSMRGSGIYAEDYTGDFYCSECDKEFELDGQTDDYGNYAGAECPECGKDLEVELPSREELAEDYWADYREGK
jgi:DNA-directed RNA polymerase subunit RPC12/RpoP